MPDGYKLTEEFYDGIIDLAPATKKQKTNVLFP